MDKTVSSIVEFLSDFSAKKVGTILFILFLIAVALVFYERLTDSSALRKLEKVNLVLTEIEKAETLTPEQETQLQGIRSSMLVHLEETLADDSFSLALKTSKVTLSLDGLLRFICGGLALFIATFVLAIKSRRNHEHKNTAMATGVLGVLFGVIGVFIPQIWWPWFHVFGIPLVAMILLAILGIALQSKGK
jgi:hypothetical protein